MSEPTRDEVNQMKGPVLLEIGASWCGFCQAIQPQLTILLARYPAVRHIKIEDGKGRPLGRSFGVKLWPTLVFMRDGQLIHQVVRPSDAEIAAGIAGLMA